LDEKEIEAFFRRPSILRLMFQAVEDEQPVACAIADRLKAEFGDLLNYVDMRRLLETIIQSVLEDYGYQLAEMDVPCTKRSAFKGSMTFTQKPSETIIF
jgi:hypothetical protein